MDGLKGLKNIFFSIIFGIILTFCIISVGNLERIAIAIVSLMLGFFIYSIKKQSFKGCCLMLVGVLIGFQLLSISLYCLDIDETESFKVYLDKINKNSSEDVAVLLVFKGEPERYSMSTILDSIQEKTTLLNTYSIPLKLFKFKRAYEWTGVSRYNEHSVNIGESLSQHLGNGYDVYMSYCRGKPSLTSVFNNYIVDKEYNRLIIVPVFLSEDRDYINIAKEVERLDFHNSKIQIKSLNTLFDSVKIVRGLIQEINSKSIEADKNNLGFLITDLSLGDSENEFNAKSKNQEALFTEEIKNKLVEMGYEERKIKFANFKNEREGIRQRIIELQQYGVSSFYIIGINDIYNSVEEGYKVGKIISNIEKKEDINISYIEGWGLNNWLIDELEYRIRIFNTQEWKP